MQNQFNAVDLDIPPPPPDEKSAPPILLNRKSTFSLNSLGINDLHDVESLRQMKAMLQQGLKDKTISKTKANALRAALKQTRGKLGQDAFADAVEEEQVACDIPQQSSLLSNLPEEDKKSGIDSVLDDSDMGKARMTCMICHNVAKEQFQLLCSHIFCSDCLHSYIMGLVGKKKAVGIMCPAEVCKQEVNVKDIQTLLTADEFNEQYLPATFAAFIEQDSMTMVCPNPKGCSAVISLDHVANLQVPEKILETDSVGKPLNPKAWLHFKEFRVRCRRCETVFCAECKAVPYHLGFTCSQWKEYKDARQCRFCKTKLDDSNLAKNPPSEALRDVCIDDECLAKRDLCCSKFKPCGCPCNGIRGEDRCLPCLKCDFPDEDMMEEFCGICFVEALSEAPCIMIDCSHIFHFECVKKKITSGYPGARIDFAFTKCSLCKQKMNHPMLDAVLAPWRSLEEVIIQKALQRLKFEGLEKDPEIVNPNGRYHNKPEEYALHAFLFYMCCKCKKPYFAGGYQCQEANAAFDPNELICTACQPHNVSECKVHGREWLVYKCKYCCNVAQWYCWNNTHFCTACHKPGVWQPLVNMTSGKNKKRFWEYPQCAGLKKQMLPILQNRSLSDDQKEKEMAKFLSVPGQCPLGKQHPPNGVEYGLGCSMCADQEAEAENRALLEKAKRENEELHKRMDLFFANSFKDGLTFNYLSDFDENGILYFLGSAGKTQRWRNPADLGLVRVFSSGLGSNPPSAPANAIVGRTAVRCVSAPIKNAWFALDFIDRSVKPTHYTLRHYSSWDTEALRNWRLEGSNDGVHWDTLSTHLNDEALNTKGAAHTWQLSVFTPYRMFRVIQTGKNSNNHEYLALSGFEIYGVLLNRVIQGGAAQLQALAMYTSLQSYDHQELKYQADFDENGLFYLLGTCGKTQSWRNPADLGLVVVSSSGLATNPPSVPTNAIVGRQTVRCVTASRMNSWFVIDLLKLKFIPTAYSLRHYNTWDTECLRFWTFDGSNDGINWVTLLSHSNDQSLNGKGSTHTWTIKNSLQPFRLFRLLQTGNNSNNHLYLACSGIELYGTLYTGPPVPALESLSISSHGQQQQQQQIHQQASVHADVPTSNNLKPQAISPPPYSQAVSPPQAPSLQREVSDNTFRREFKYVKDFDENGALFWLGTMGYTQPWENPAIRGIVNCSASGLAANPASLPASTIAGRSCQRCVTNMAPNSWFCVDLLAHTIIPTSYTLMHYNSWDIECLRNWVLEGSINGMQWIVLREHINDTALNGVGSTHTWHLSGVNRPFRLLRIRQTGKNSNQHDMLALSGVEFYGFLAGITIKPQSSPSNQPHMPNQAVSQPRSAHVNQLVFQYQKDFDTNGIIYWLGTQQNSSRQWLNPSQFGVVQVTSSSVGSKSLPPAAILGRETIRCVTNSQFNSWFIIRFFGLSIIPTTYTLRHYSSFAAEALRNWKFEGSDDGYHWDTLRVHHNDQSLNGIGSTASWNLPNVQQPFSFFRIIQTGPNSNNHDFLALSGFEIYGNVIQDAHSVQPHVSSQFAQQSPSAFPRAPSVVASPLSGMNSFKGGIPHSIAAVPEQLVEPPSTPNPMNMHKSSNSISSKIPGFHDGIEFVYSSDFDENGIFFFLGTLGKTRPWRNPGESGFVDVEASSLAMRPPSEPASAIVGLTTVRCATENKPNQWFIVDLKNFAAKPTSYSLRHYSSWDTEALRNWRFEGSNDKIRWDLLKEHVDDRSLLLRGSTHTWSLSAFQPYRFFRILHVGLNSNGHLFLSCSGLELYGSLHHSTVALSVANPAKAFTQNISLSGGVSPLGSNAPKCEFRYQFDFDENGLFFYLGSDGKTKPWRNPAELGRVVCSSSGLAIKPPSVPASALVGRSTVRCVTIAMQKPWFMVDLKEHRFIVTAYTLRHYSSWDTEAVRTWRFEASNDLNKWHLLREHINDQSLMYRGATCSWVVQPSNEPFRYFRIIMCDVNSNRNLFLACSGIEMYGFLY